MRHSASAASCEVALSLTSLFAHRSIWKEGDLFHEWFPSVSWSEMIAKESDAEIIFKYGGNNPLGKSESILHGWGVNHLSAAGFFLICGGSVREWNGVEFPRPPRRTFR